MYMFRESLFFLTMIAIVTTIVYGALYPGKRYVSGYDSIRQNGYLAEESDLQYIKASPGTSALFIAAKNGEPSYLTLSAHLSQSAAPPSAGVFAPLNARYETAFAGRRLKMTLTARQGQTSPVETFQMGYFTAGPGDSGWQRFQLTSDFQDYSFNFTPKAQITEADIDYFGVWPDEEGLQRTMDVLRYKIEVLDAAP